MKRDQLLGKLAKVARAMGFALEIDLARGKAGYCVVRCNGRFSVIKSGEMTPLMKQIIRRQLGLV